MDEQVVAVLDQLYRIELWGGIALLLFLENLRPGLPFPDERSRVRHILLNFTLWAVGFLLADILLQPLLFPGSPFAAGTLWTASLASMPLWFQIIGGVLILDLAIWILHWLCHRYRWLWLIHAVHHSDPHLDATTTLRGHPLESVLTVVWQALVLALLGLPVWIMACRVLLSAPVSLLHHSNIVLPERLDRVMRGVLVSPAMHRVHHSPRMAETNSNYGGMFSFWDRLFGTYHDPLPGRAPDVGLDALRGADWQSLAGLLLTPFRARRLVSL